MSKLTFKLIGTAAFGDIYRSKVPGGWLIYACQVSNDGVYPHAHGGPTFYPDPTHEWDGGSLD